MTLDPKDVLNGIRSAKQKILETGLRSPFSFPNKTRTLWYTQFFDREVSLTSADYLCEQALRVGSTRSQMQVLLVASHCNGDTPVRVEPGDTITLSLQQADHEDGTFADVGPTFCVTAPPEAMEAEADSVLLELNLGNMTKPWAKVKIKGIVSGKIDVALGWEAHK